MVPHVGDLGQLHQHLVLFNHIGIEHPALFLEHIPHLREHFVHPVQVTGGVWRGGLEGKAKTNPLMPCLRGRRRSISHSPFRGGSIALCNGVLFLFN